MFIDFEKSCGNDVFFRLLFFSSLFTYQHYFSELSPFATVNIKEKKELRSIIDLSLVSSFLLPFPFSIIIVHLDL